MEWLQQIFDKILSLFPSIQCIKTYESGIKFTLGKYTKRAPPGWYIIWPIIQELVYMEIQTQVVDLRPQSTRTKDGYSIVISGAFSYHINDVEKAIINVQDVEQAIEKLSLGIIINYVNKRTLGECEDLSKLRAAVKNGLTSKCKDWGIVIEEVFITDLDKAINIRLLGGYNGSVS